MIDKDRLSWSMVPGSTTLSINYDGQHMMRLSIHEIIETASRSEVLKHVIECDRSHWLTRWQAEKKIAYEQGMADAVTILRGME